MYINVYIAFGGNAKNVKPIEAINLKLSNNTALIAGNRSLLLALLSSSFHGDAMEIYLRPMLAADAADYATAINESLSSLRPWISWAHENYQPEEALEWFRLIDRQREKGEANEMGIFAVDDDRFLGAAGIRYGQPPVEHSAIGYWVRQSEQRQGVARQAVLKLAHEGFSRPGIKTIEIVAAEDNHASRAVAVSCGAHFIDFRYGLIVLAEGAVNAAIYHLRREDFVTG